MANKGAEHTMGYDWIPGAGVGLLGSAIAWLLSWRINSAKNEGAAEVQRKADVAMADAQQKADMIRADDLRADLRELKADWRAGIEDVRKLAENMAAVQSSQNVVNAVTAKAVDAITEKLDKHEACLADHTSTLRLLTNIVMARSDAKEQAKP